jgi:nitroreductase
MAKIVRRDQAKEQVAITDDGQQTRSLPIPSFDLQEVNRLIRLRRSIFPVDYSGEIVPKEEIEHLLENANWAPNHGHTEPWHFIVFSGKGLADFAAEHADLYRSQTPAESFQEKKYQKLKNRPLAASHVIAICMKRGSNPKIPLIEEIEAVACAVQNMHLTATALGLACYWSSGGMTYDENMKRLLGLEEQDHCLGFFYVGKPKGSWVRGKRKSDWRAKTEWRE